jgi:LacI family transcriptional regulator
LIQFLRKETPDVVVIAHELTPLSRSALQGGEFDALISQDLGHIVRSAVRLMRARVDVVPYNALQERIRVEIFLKENLPPET